MARRRFMLGVAGAMCALALTAAGVTAFADEPAAAGQAPEEAAAQEIVETRMGNTIGYAGGIDYWGEYENYIGNLQYAQRDADNAEANAPARYQDYYGNTYQPTPADPAGWNNTYLNADDRGCLSCHVTIEDALIEMNTRHDVYIPGYATLLTVDNCLTCHGATPHGDKVSASTTLHGSHTGNPAFEALGGTCESCHFITPQGEFEMWDLVKYDQFKGLTKVAAEDADVQLSYSQDVVSDINQQFFKSLWIEPSSWRATSDPAVADEWVVSFGGEVENPLEASVSELKEMFGTKTVTLKQNCIANTTANAWIFQAEFTGIPLQAIIDYVKPAESVTNIKFEAEDGYNLVSPSFASVDVEDCILVTEINGEPLPATQGWPLAIAIPKAAASQYVKAIQAINFVTNPNFDPNAVSAGKPMSAVLNYPDGVVLPAGEPVHLEGYADAIGSPVTKVEYSLDGGKTWIAMETPDNDAERWTYWTLDFTPEEAGTYLLKIRTTCLQPDGTEEAGVRDTNFLFTLE